MAVIPESSEVRAEGWLRGDWWALREKLPSSAWLHSKLPRSAMDWYMWGIFAMAGAELAWSMWCKLSKRASKKMRPQMTEEQVRQWREKHAVPES